MRTSQTADAVAFVAVGTEATDTAGAAGVHATDADADVFTAGAEAADAVAAAGLRLLDYGRGGLGLVGNCTGDARRSGNR
ncbi:hypothetical protein ACQ4WX_01130 [Streptomyces lasalocidi]